MKITKEYLKKIILEELASEMQNSSSVDAKKKFKEMFSQAVFGMADKGWDEKEYQRLLNLAKAHGLEDWAKMEADSAVRYKNIY